MELDGKRQRNALTAAENAIRALGAGDAERARKAAAKAVDLDQIGVFTFLASAVGGAAAELEEGRITAAAWDEVAAASGPGPLAALVDEARDQG
jgi:hypothetical protein